MCHGGIDTKGHIVLSDGRGRRREREIGKGHCKHALLIYVESFLIDWRSIKRFNGRFLIMSHPADVLLQPEEDGVDSHIPHAVFSVTSFKRKKKTLSETFYRKML